MESDYIFNKNDLVFAILVRFTPNGIESKGAADSDSIINSGSEPYNFAEFEKFRGYRMCGRALLGRSNIGYNGKIGLQCLKEDKLVTITEEMSCFARRHTDGEKNSWAILNGLDCHEPDRPPVAQLDIFLSDYAYSELFEKVSGSYKSVFLTLATSVTEHNELYRRHWSDSAPAASEITVDGSIEPTIKSIDKFILDTRGTREYRAWCFRVRLSGFDLDANASIENRFVDTYL